MTAQLNLWQQDYSALQAKPQIRIAIRRSRKARRLILQTLPPRTVEVIVPHGVSSRAVADFVQTHRAWIDRAGSELLAGYPDAEQLPTSVELRATGQVVDVCYEPDNARRNRFSRHADRLVLNGNPDNRPACLALLRRWLLSEARRTLKPWLQSESLRTGLVPKAVAVRLQKTRWGSCSSQGTISLNASLMLVEPELVRYLLVHELCHLAHMSHSRKYWKTVSRFDADYREHDRQLGASWSSLPTWLSCLANGGTE